MKNLSHFHQSNQNIPFADMIRQIRFFFRISGIIALAFLGEG
jgi:hypothetical protein